MAKVVLSAPLKYKGSELREIELKLEGLTGRDLIDVETQMNSEGKFALMADYSKLYLSRVGAKAAGLPVEVLETLGAKDFNKIVTAVQLFFMGSDSPAPSGSGASPAVLEIQREKS